MKTEAVFTKYITEVYGKSMDTDAVITYILPRYVLDDEPKAVFTKYIPELYEIRLKLYLPIYYRGILKRYETEALFTNTLPRYIRKVWRLMLYLPNTLPRYIRKLCRLKLCLHIHYQGILKKYGD